MLNSTKRAICAILDGDPSVDAGQRSAALDILAGKTATSCVFDSRPIDRALSRKQVCELLGVKARTVQNYVARGLLKPCRFGPMGRRANGYAESSVRKLLAGSR